MKLFSFRCFLEISRLFHCSVIKVQFAQSIDFTRFFELCFRFFFQSLAASAKSIIAPAFSLVNTFFHFFEYFFQTIDSFIYIVSPSFFTLHIVIFLYAHYSNSVRSITFPSKRLLSYKKVSSLLSLTILSRELPADVPPIAVTAIKKIQIRINASSTPAAIPSR